MKITAAVVSARSAPFAIETLEYLQRGGRIGRAAAFAGSLLNLQPILAIEAVHQYPLRRADTHQRQRSCRAAELTLKETLLDELGN